MVKRLTAYLGIYVTKKESIELAKIKRGAIYTRVTPHRHRTCETNLPYQETTLKKCCANKNIQIICQYGDVQTEDSFSTSGWEELIEFLEAEIGK